MAAPPGKAAPAPPAKAAKAEAPRNTTLAVYAAVCLAACAGLLVFAAPRGFVVLGTRLDLPYALGLAGAAVLIGAWGAFAARERRLLPAAVLAAALLSPAVDARLPLDRLPLHFAAAVAFILFLEFAVLHAKVARLSRMPRAHLTTGGQAREVELHATAGRIASSWPTPMAMAVGLVLGCIAVQQGLAAVLPAQLGQSLELRGAFGLGLSAVLVLGGLGAYVALVRLPRERREAPEREDEGHIAVESVPSTAGNH